MTWRPRWNLRIFLGVMLITGCLAGLWGRREMQRRRENAAMKSLSSSGVQFQFGDGSYSNDPGAKLDGGAAGAYVYEQNNQSDTTIDLSQLRELKGLKTLHFGCKSIPPDAIRHLERLSKLEELHLSYFPVDDAMLESIGRISSLKRLHIDNSQMTVAGIKHLAALQRLTQLDIQTMNQPAENIEGAGKYLAQLQSLQDLSLKANLTSDDLFELSKLKNLRELNLQVPQVKVKHIEELAKGSRLQTLSIYHVNRGNQMLAAISKLSELKFLSCALARADDEGMHHLKSLAKLEKIELIHSAATDRAVDILAELPNLKQIQLRHPKVRGGWISVKNANPPPWPAGAEGSGIFERTKDGELKEMTNAEIEKRGYW